MYMTTREVAARWGCDRTTVTERARSGELVGMRLGRDWRFAVSAVESFEQRNTTSAETVETAPAPAAPKEVRAPVKLDGFTLPANYEPVFKDLWPLHETKKSASRG